MQNPEFPIRIALPENRDLIRQAAGQGIDVFDHIEAVKILSTSAVTWILTGHMRFSESRELLGNPIVMQKPLNVQDMLTTLPVARQAAGHILGYAEKMRSAAIRSAMLEMELDEGGQRVNNARRMVVTYDLGVGMGVVPMLVENIEGIRIYDQIEGIRDDAVKGLLLQYESDPVRVIHDAVEAHANRYVRGSDETGIYVPEFLAAGARHADVLFANMYKTLTAPEI